ncbi:MAG: hypothetical protein VX529_09560 [Pseudomonadota bacterium]|nr:hypothetical protein [Pseudomonadota bacterium]
MKTRRADMAKSAEDLAERRDELVRRAEEIDARIARGHLDGADEKELAQMRRRRDLARSEAREVEASRTLLLDRQREAADAERDRSLRAARSRARESARAFEAAAEAVDARLAELEEAHAALVLAELDLSRDLRAAGLGESGRIRNRLAAAIRWASWASAEGYSEAAQVPRVGVARRRTLTASARSIVPQIPED